MDHRITIHMVNYAPEVLNVFTSQLPPLRETGVCFLISREALIGQALMSRIV